MDSKTFDELIKQVGTARLTRLSALRALLGGSALAITGAAFATEDADAKRGKKGRKRKNRRPRRRVKGVHDTAPPPYKPTKPKEEPTTEEPTTEAPLECDAYGNCPDEKCSTWKCVEVKYDDGYGGYITKGFCEYSPVVCEEKPCKIGHCDQKTGKCKYEPVICEEKPCKIGYCNESSGKCKYEPVICEPKPCKIGYCNEKTGKCEYDQVICEYGYYCDPYAENYDPYNPTCVPYTGGAG
jgi:hypothetical protein